MGMFKPATRQKLKLRMALDGPSGSGKTYTALRFAFALAGTSGKVAVIDTEHRSASKYKGDSPDGVPFQFDVCELEHYAPSTYVSAIQEAGRAGYDVLVVDSLSHAWEGVGGALDQIDKAKDKGGNQFTAWKDVTPQHREMLETILSAPCHVIVTMRSKMEYVLEPDPKTGKMVPKKVGMAPIQRQGMEYEFDIVCDMDVSHLLVVSKTRCRAVDGRRVSCPDASFMGAISEWLNTGENPGPTFVQPAASRSASTPAPAISPPTATVSPAAAPPTSGPQPAKGIRLDANQESDQTASQSLNERCSTSQRNEIISLAKECEIPATKLSELIQAKGFRSLAELPVGEAIKLIARLQEKKSKMEADSLF